MTGTIRLDTLAKGFALYGTDAETCLFVLNLDVGAMDKGVRMIHTDDVTESLLASIECLFTLIVA